jgi:hypothetical protein
MPYVFYCTSKTSSSGCQPEIAASGEPSFSGNDAFFVTAVREHTNTAGTSIGIFFWGLAPAGSPFGGGFLCVAPPLIRTPPQIHTGGSACSPPFWGSFYSFHFSRAYMSLNGLAPGNVFYGQYWNRDSGFAPPNNVGMTGGIQVTVCP